MNRKQLLLIMALAGAVSSGIASEGDHNGAWWRGQGYSAKCAYAGGLFDGKTVGSNLLAYGMSAQVLVRGDTVASYTSARQKCVQFDGGQLVEGLDRFYADPRNTNIPVSKASLVFVHTVAGTPRDTLLRMIEEYRKPGC